MRELFVHEWFEQIAFSCKDAPAILSKSGVVTYGELLLRAERLATGLANAGARKGDRAAILFESRVETIVAILAALKSGCAFIPLLPSDPAGRIEDLLRIADPQWVMIERGFEDRHERLLSGFTAQPEIMSQGAALYGPSGRGSSASGGSVWAPDDMAYVYFTSGSTGHPKAVAGRLKAIDHFIRWEISDLRLAPGARVSQFTRPSFDAFLRDIFVPLCSGGVVCIPDALPAPWAPAELAIWIAEQKINLIHCVPSMLRLLLAEFEKNPGLFSSLRWVLAAGEAMRPGDVRRWFGVFGARARLVNLYGPTETTMTKFAYTVKPGDEQRRRIPIGKPIPGCSAILLNAQGGISPRGTVGKIHLRTPYRSLGYLNRGGMTGGMINEAFIPNPFGKDPDDLLYNTGDLGVWMEDGNFEFLGREDRQIKLRGIRIDPGEIEAAFAAIDGVKEIGVVASEFGEGDYRLTGFISLRTGVSLEQVKEQALRTLHDYMVPGEIHVLEKLPLTPNGKIDYGALRPPAKPQTDAGFLTPVEELLAGIWQSILNAERAGADDDFFAMGGHSLSAAQMLMRVREVFRVDLPLRALFESSTLRKFAARIERGAGWSAPKIRKDNVRTPDGMPLSFGQEQLWFLNQLDPSNASYNMPVALRADGDLNFPLLAETMDYLVRRHESLRTSFSISGGKPAQIVQEPAPVPWRVIDCSCVPQPMALAQRLVAQMAELPFDLAAPPLRVYALRVAKASHVLLFNIHHIVSDEWSNGILVREVSEVYSALAGSRTPALPEITVQYADYAAWQRQSLSGDKLEKELTYWRGRLAEAPEILDLPCDFPRPGVKTYRGATYHWNVADDLSGNLRNLARTEGVTLFMALCAAWQAVLARYCGQSDIPIGVPIANRPGAEFERVIGFFANTLVLRTQIQGEQSFRGLLQGVRETVLDAYAHQGAPFEKIVEDLQPGRDLSRSPVFQVLFAMHHAQAHQLELPGLRLSEVEFSAATAQFDIGLTMVENGPRLSGFMNYSTDLFRPSTLERMAHSFELFLREAANSPDRPVDDLPVLSPEEYNTVVYEWNRTGLPREDLRLVHEWFGAQARRSPRSPAIVYEQTEFSYQEINRRANQLANYLVTLGVGPETLVGVCLQRCPEMVIALLAVWKAGGAYVPLDPSDPLERLAYMLQDSQTPLLLTSQPIAERMPACSAAMVLLDIEWQKISGQSEEAPATDVQPRNLAYVIYTSGSTGAPKGVAVEHAGVSAYVAWSTEAYGVGPDSVSLVHSSIGFDLTVTSLYPPLCAGGRVLLVPEGGDGAATERLARDLEANQDWTLLKITPGQMQALARIAPDERRINGGRAIVVGGEALSYEQLAFRRRFPEAMLVNEYGPTETVVGCCVHTAGPESSGSVPIGRPIASAEIYLLDAAFRPAPVPATAEIFIGGMGVARGYLGQPDLTAEHFLPDGLSGRHGARLYRTGDFAKYRADGVIEYAGRKDQQVKIRGYRVETGEVENVLRQHPLVLDAAADVWQDTAGSRQLIAYIVPRSAQLDMNAMREFSSRKLPAYMVPSYFIAMEALPLTSNGKLARRELPGPPRQGRSGGAAVTTDVSPVADIVAGVWKEVLHSGELGGNDNFFERGGHSLLAAEIVGRLRGIFRVDLQIRTVFEAPTVAAFAAQIEAELAMTSDAPVAPVLTSAPSGRNRLLSSAQKWIWTAQRLDPGNIDYTWCQPISIEGSVDMARLQACLNEVLARHDVLHSIFPESNGEPELRVLPFIPLLWQVADLSTLEDGMRQRCLRKLVFAERERPYDLQRGPLVRIIWLRLAEDHNVLLFASHGIVSDGFSLGIIGRELGAAYRMDSGSASGERRLQYSDYACWQREMVGSDYGLHLVGFWQDYLRGARPFLLPTDRPRTGRKRHPGSAAVFPIPAGIHERAKALAQKEGATAYMFYLAVFFTLLRESAGEDDLTVATTVQNRQREGTQAMVGWFPNHVPVRVRFESGQCFEQSLSAVREAILRIHAHHELPFAELVETVAPPYDPLNCPWLNTHFSYFHGPALEVADSLLRMSILDVRSEEYYVRREFVCRIEETAEGALLNLVYAADLLEARTIELLGTRFVELASLAARGAVAHPHDNEQSGRLIGTTA